MSTGQATEDETAVLPRVRLLRLALGMLLILAGIGMLGLWRVLDGTEPQPFASNATPPQYVRVTAGNTYTIAVPGGVGALVRRGIAVSSAQQTIALQCSYTPRGTATPTDLELTPEPTDSVATTMVGQFVAPVSGDIHVSCSGWGTVFVPDSDDRPTDYAGTALVASVLALTVGVILALAELRRLAASRRPV